MGELTFTRLGATESINGLARAVFDYLNSQHRFCSNVVTQND
jgi:hypothetical protein